MSYDYDAIVVGSGAGGGAIAYKLTKAGYKVALLDTGTAYNSNEFTRFELDAIRKLWWKPRWTTNYELNGGKNTDEINLGMGRTVGGGTTIFTAVAHRAPNENFDDWTSATGLVNENSQPFSHNDVDSHYTKIEGETSVRKYTDWDLGVQRLKEGYSKVGIEIEAVNAYIDENCDHNGCIFGCPTGSKKGSLLSYVIPGIYEGLTLYQNSHVEEILIRKSNSDKPLEAYGVKYRQDGELKQLTGKIVIVSAGALQTPQIFLDSKIRDLTDHSKSSMRIGENMAVNTNTFVFGKFKETLNNWLIHPLSAHVTEFSLEKDGGFILEMSEIMDGPLGFAEVILDNDSRPMVGKELTDALLHYKNMAGVLIAIHDHNDGRIFYDDEGKLKYHKPVTNSDRDKFSRARKLVDEAFYAAGAEETYGAIYISHHPQGTCAAGEDKSKSVVDSTLESHDVKGLFACDASVFPSIIDANPSLTIYAMADRLAEHLTQRSPYLRG